MHIEYEIRVLDIDKEKIIKKLEELGAIRVKEYNYKRYVYDLKPKKKDCWLRLRTDGYSSTLTYKNITDNKIDGTKELEIEVSNFDDTKEMLEIMGYINKGYQENRRLRYMLDDIEIDIDEWPMIPVYLEIEGKNSEEVLGVIEKLDVDKDKITALNTQDIYLDIYGIDITNMKNIKF